MKRIVVFMFAVALAGLAGAAQVSWNFTGVSADPVGTAWNGYSAYLCDASVFSAGDLAADLAGGNFGKLGTDGFVQAKSGTAQQGSLQYAKISSMYRGGDYAKGTSHTFYTLILNADGEGATWFTISQDVSAIAPGSGFLQMGFTNLSANAQAAWTQVAPIPEPTSGLLLLLGVAGLALRRRRA